MIKVGVETLKAELGEEHVLAKRAWELVEAGAAEWSGGKPAGSRRRPQSRGKSASDIVLEERENRQAQQDPQLKAGEHEW